VKTTTTFCLLLLTVLLRAQPVTTDTISIHADTACGNFMPSRMYHSVQSKLGDGYSYTDSIRVCGTVVNGFNTQYYLIVYDEQGVKRMEGNFFDAFANGHCIHYDSKGRKLSEGNYRMKGRGKRRHSKQKGKWIYYDPKGNVRRKR
jgi:hypothetical protein